MRYLDRIIRWVTFYSKNEWIFIGSIAALIGVLYLPWAYHYVWERRQLVTEGVSTTGKVLSHTAPGNRICAHAIIAYEVEAKPYSIELEGCQVGPTALPVGTSVTVWYVPAKPLVAWAKANGSSNREWTDTVWTNFVFAFVVLVIGLAIWRQHLEKPACRV
jgi:hypothetical protein